MAASDPSGRRPAKSKKPERVDVDQRKERVLHTRVPESLDRHLKSRARGLGLSVSTVVRNVLLNTFGLVEDIVTDSTNIALALTGEDLSADAAGRRGRNNPPAGDRAESDVVAWQEAVLNVNAVCDQCNAVLRKGARAAIGVRERPGPRAILCPRCLDGVGAAHFEPKRKRRRASS
jgi:hypothetical protein